MRRIVLRRGADIEGFRRAVRALVADHRHPRDVVWECADAPGLFDEGPPVADQPVSLPRAAARLVELAVCHRDPARYPELYTLIWRLTHGEPRLMDIASDPLVHALERKAKSVRRDIHKMHAFVRFRANGERQGREHFAAWFEPEHFILEAASRFFVERFGSFSWSIVTPVGSVHWDGAAVTHGPPGTREQVPASDAFEAGWIGYYESTFNPARLNEKVMRGHMPKKYWRNMPEAAAIPGLVRSAPALVDAMVAREAARYRKRLPEKAVAAMKAAEPRSLQTLNAIIRAAEPFVKGGTRAVLGEGPTGADIAFVGEQPGDEEDRQGRPFAGPAGRLLDAALAEAGIDRGRCYLTNAVKHFKYEWRGSHRLHKSPTAGEVRHYRWWLLEELEIVRPRLVVSLGASALLAITGEQRPMLSARGPADFGFATVHPSYLLRLPDAEDRASAYREFVADLVAARRLAEARDVARAPGIAPPVSPAAVTGGPA